MNSPGVNPIFVVQMSLVKGGMISQFSFNQIMLGMGRDEDNDVILDDPRISRHHLRVEQSGGNLSVTDLGSTNGTLISGLPLSPRVPRRLTMGEEVEAGSFSFSIRPARIGDPLPSPTKVRLSPFVASSLEISYQGRVQKVVLSRPIFTLGRASDNDIVIDHEVISRHHARIEQKGDSFVIYDLNSTNGLSVNGQRVTECRLEENRPVVIGRNEVLITFHRPVGTAPAGEPEPKHAITGWNLQAPVVPAASQPAAQAIPASRQAPPSAYPAPPPAAAQPQDKTGYLNLKGRDIITVGRAPDNRVVLNNPQVSAHHAIFERMGTRYRIKDLKSDTGVYVNAKRIDKEAWLKQGDEIRIGGVRLMLREEGIQHFSAEGLRLDVFHLQKWVTKSKNLLQDISLCIHPEEFVALVGMSGSGKSTLMDAINGFRPATQGNVVVNGVDLYSNFEQFRGDLGYVPQKDIVHQELTVYSALNYAAQLRMPADTSGSERHQRIMEVLHDLDLTERKDLPISRLSGGQLKRVSIGVELLTRPRLFFLDEPTSGLDPGTELEMMKLLRRLADQGRTIMLITHATKNVMMCDKVIFLARGGFLAYYGPPEEALPYFDQYRSEQERQQKDIEFDDIYMILNDEKRGKGKDWDTRYRGSHAFQENVVKRLTHARSGGLAQGGYPGGAARPRPVQAAPQVNKVGMMRQFLILSARNIKIMTQDRFGLALMLALAPMIGMMDFIWGTNLFDIEKGDTSKIIMLLFMGALISILVGAMASVREIVKEVDIYKRERAINLKLLSYILSKVWVGVVLSIYQAIVLLAFRYILVLHASPLGPGEYVLFFITLFLGNFSGYVMGLCISAASPNQNVALLLVIVVLVPQFLFSGALLPLNLIPGGQAISSAISTRWAFESMVNISGIGKDIANDPCWKYIQDNNIQPGDLTQDQKDQMGCKCMGTAMFDSCTFPGIRSAEYYTSDAIQALAAPQPVEPEQPTAYPTLTRLPSLTPLATYTPMPSVTPWATPSDQRQMQAYQKTREAQGNDYQATREAQGSDYADASRNQGTVYNDQMVAQGNVYEDIRNSQGDEYKAAMQTYGDDSKSWQRNRDKAISSAEGKIKAVWDNFSGAFQGGVIGRWFAMAVILGVVFFLLLFFQKRKDTL